MKPSQEKSEAVRRVMLTAVMIALLAGSVALAWFVSAARRHDPQVAADILADIRQKGLDAFWGDEPFENWCVIYGPDGKAVGWYVERRLRMEDGNFVGTRVRELGGELSIERWMLDNQARTGKYQGDQWQLQRVRVSGRPVQVSVKLPATEIYLAGETLTVRRTDGRRKIEAQTQQVPANYIPEGMTNLFLYQAALKGRKTECAMVINARAFAGREIEFTRYRVAPAGGRVVDLGIGQSVETITFDETGRKVRSGDVTGSYWEERTTAREVTTEFPRAKRYLQPTTDPAEPETQPTTREAEGEGNLQGEGP